MPTQSTERFHDSFDNAVRYLIEFVDGKPASRLHGLSEEQRDLVALAVMAVNILADVKVADLQDQKYIDTVERSLSLAINDVIE